MLTDSPDEQSQTTFILLPAILGLFGPVMDRQTTESDARDPIMHKDRCAQKSSWQH